jgi:2-polyprenyl-3-methyl-5-hydroxy-6-metoxy-1,4-benzoquinol methylase
VDVSAQEIPGFYDLIIIMDIAQHITDERKFRYAMENIKAHLNPKGVIIMSTSIGSYKRHSFYNVTRPLTAFEDVFEGYRLSESLPFCGNKMFSIRKID